MIKFENTEVMGWEAAIRGARNPMNSWERSDSGFGCEHSKDYCDFCCLPDTGCDCSEAYRNYIIGPNDLDLMRRLDSGGPVHAKYRRMITVYVDITAPLYWWKEFDTYKVGTVANSCSTMHKIAEKEFTLEDFSTEHLLDEKDYYEVLNAENEYPQMEETDGNDVYYTPKDFMEQTIYVLNFYRKKYHEISDELKKTQESYIVVALDENEKALKIRELQKKKKIYWWQMIQLLPSSYNQKRTVMLNYEVLAHIYKDRKYHKLDEWREHEPVDIISGEKIIRTIPNQHQGFCDWIKTLPYSELIIPQTKSKASNDCDCFQPILENVGKGDSKG